MKNFIYLEKVLTKVSTNCVVIAFFLWTNFCMSITSNGKLLLSFMTIPLKNFSVRLLFPLSLFKHYFQLKSCKDIIHCSVLRARLHETRSKLKPVSNLKLLWNVVLLTWQFTWRFHCDNFSNNSKTLLHMCKWYLLINANLINAKQMLHYWLFFKQ